MHRGLAIDRRRQTSGAPVSAVAADPAWTVAGVAAHVTVASSASRAPGAPPIPDRAGRTQAQRGRQRRGHLARALRVGRQPEHAPALPGDGRGLSARRGSTGLPRSSGAAQRSEAANPGAPDRSVGNARKWPVSRGQRPVTGGVLKTARRHSPQGNRQGSSSTLKRHSLRQIDCRKAAVRAALVARSQGTANHGHRASAASR